jgi:hypothetical protein
VVADRNRHNHSPNVELNAQAQRMLHRRWWRSSGYRRDRADAINIRSGRARQWLGWCALTVLGGVLVAAPLAKHIPLCTRSDPRRGI